MDGGFRFSSMSWVSRMLMNMSLEKLRSGNSVRSVMGEVETQNKGTTTMIGKEGKENQKNGRKVVHRPETRSSGKRV